MKAYITFVLTISWERSGILTKKSNQSIKYLLKIFCLSVSPSASLLSCFKNNFFRIFFLLFNCYYYLFCFYLLSIFFCDNFCLFFLFHLFYNISSYYAYFFFLLKKKINVWSLMCLVFITVSEPTCSNADFYKSYMQNSVQSSSVNSSTSNPSSIASSSCHYGHSTASTLPAVTREEKQSRRSVGFRCFFLLFFHLKHRIMIDVREWMKWILMIFFLLINTERLSSKRFSLLELQHHKYEFVETKCKWGTCL